MSDRPLDILFNAWADKANVNAQNLNARDVAVRLAPARFRVTLFLRGEADPRLRDRSNIRFVRIPGRLGSLAMVWEMLRPRDLIFYTRISRADTLYRKLQKIRRGGPRIIAPIESQLGGLESDDVPRTVLNYYGETVRLAHALVPNAPFVAETLLRRYGIRAPVIFSGVDCAYFRSLRAGNGPSGGRLRVLFAGSLQARKHPELVLEAAERFPDAEFVILGNGPLREALENRIRGKGLSNARLMRAMDYQDYAKELVSADVFLFPSRSEGLPKVTLEAAAAGIPVLVFDDYRTPSVVDGVTGYQSRTFEEMMEKLSTLLSDEALRKEMGAAAKDHAKIFDWNAIVPQWEALFERIADEGPCG